MRIAILTLALLAVAGGANAAIYFVKADGTGDYATIQAALDAVPANSIVELADGTYTGAGNRDLDFKGKALTLRSQSGRAAACVIDCQGSSGSPHRGFYFHTAETNASVVKGITIRNGYAADHGGGVYCSSASPSILNCVITACEAEQRGGGVYGISSEPVINNCVISNNTATHGGGIAYWTYGGDLYNDLITGNSADYGDAVYLYDPDIYVHQCTFDGNFGRNYSAALYGDSGGGFTLTNCIVWNNDGYPMLNAALATYSCVYGGFPGTGNISTNPQFATGPGGGYYLGTSSPCVNTGSASASALTFTAGDGTVALSRLTTRADETNDSGTVDMGYHHGHVNPIYVPDRYATVPAALDNAFSGEQVIVRDGDWYENIDFHGRAIDLGSEHGASVTQLGGTLSGCVVTFMSGEGRGSTLHGFLIYGGRGSSGGGIMIDGAAPSIWLCDLAGNAATGSGGGLYASFSRVSMSSTTVRGNTAASEGGGICVAGAGSRPSFSNVQVYDNQTGTQGGGAAFAWAAVTLDHCSFTDNMAAHGGGIYAYGGHLDVSYCTVANNGATSRVGGGIGRESGPIDLANTIIAFNDAAGATTAVECVGTVALTAACCDIYGNTGGNWTGCLAGFEGTNGNFSLDPLFCDRAGGDYGLHANSMCAAAMNPGCGQIGFTSATCGLEIFTVRADGLGQYATLQAAIDAAFDGIIVRASPGTYTGAGNRDLDFKGKAITLESSDGVAANTIIDCQGSSSTPRRGFYFHTNEDSTSILRNVTIRNGWTSASGSGGGIYCISGAAPKISGCVLYNNHAYDGGGLQCYLSSPIVENCAFNNNTASDAGGGIECNTSSPEVRNCTFYSNWALWGGGAVYDYRSSTKLRHCLFRSNSTNNWGAAIHSAESVSRTEARNCTFMWNACNEGGAIYARVGAIVTLAGSTLFGNTASVRGSAIRALSSGAVNVTNSIVWGQNYAIAEHVSLQSSGAVSFGCSDLEGGQAGIHNDGTGVVTWNAGNLTTDPLFCDAPLEILALKSTSPCAAANNPSCGLIGSDPGLCSATGIGDAASALPPAPALHPCAPNPFNPRTVVRFELPQTMRARVRIFGVDGRLVATLVDAELPAGGHETAWSARDDRGRPVASGLYFCRLEAGSFVETQRMTLLK